MDYKRLELKLRRIVEKRLREGWALEKYNYITNTGCCAVGAMCVELNVDSGVAVSNLTNIDFSVLNSISLGFDDNRKTGIDSKAYAIGARIRRIYCDDNGQVE